MIATHTGGWVGTSTIVERHVDRGLTVALFSNNESRDPTAEAAAIAALF